MGVAVCGSLVVGCSGVSVSRNDSDRIEQGGDSASTGSESSTVGDPSSGIQSGFDRASLPDDAIEAYEKYSGYDFPDDVEVIGWALARPRGVEYVEVVSETTPERAAELAARVEGTSGPALLIYRGVTNARLDEALAREPGTEYSKQNGSSGWTTTTVLGDGDTVTVVLSAMIL